MQEDVRVPRVDITGGQDDFGVGIGFDEFFGESAGGPVANSLNSQLRLNRQCRSTHLAISQKLVPLLASKLPNTVILGGQSIVPHQAVGRVLHAGGHHVVGLDIAQSLQGLAEGCIQSVDGLVRHQSAAEHTGSSCSSHAQRKHLHGHLAVALPSINAGIIGEDVSHWLRGQVIGMNQRHGVPANERDR